MTMPSRKHAQWILVTLALVTITGLTGCRSPYYSDQGAAFGGVTGALVGAALGEQNGTPLGGAALGGALGAVTGAAVGNAIDADMARERAMIEQRIGRAVQGAATSEDVIAMTEAGVPEEVIVNYIRGNGVARKPSAGDVIILHQQGVSARVLDAMQQPGPPPGAVGPPPSETVIVHEHVYGPPPVVFHRHPRWRRHRSRLHWGVSFGH